MECNKLYIPYDKWRLDCVVSENLALGKIDKVELTMSAQINEDFMVILEGHITPPRQMEL